MAGLGLVSGTGSQIQTNRGRQADHPGSRRSEANTLSRLRPCLDQPEVGHACTERTGIGTDDVTAVCRRLDCVGIVVVGSAIRSIPELGARSVGLNQPDVGAARAEAVRIAGDYVPAVSRQCNRLAKIFVLCWLGSFEKSLVSCGPNSGECNVNDCPIRRGPSGSERSLRGCPVGSTPVSSPTGSGDSCVVSLRCDPPRSLPTGCPH
jgi:hypothetical protein